MTDPRSPVLAFGAVPPPPRWLALPANRRLVGRLITMVTAGIIGGIFMAQSEAADHRRGEKLTKESYAAGFEEHRHKLLDSQSSVPVDIFAMVLLLLAVAALYEGGGIVVAPAVGWLDDTLARRAAVQRSAMLDDTDL